jgi:hypothetical protein
MKIPAEETASDIPGQRVVPAPIAGDCVAPDPLEYTALVSWDREVENVRALLRYCALRALQTLVFNDPDSDPLDSSRAFRGSRVQRDTALLVAATEALAQAKHI